MTQPAPPPAAFALTRPQTLYVWISGVFVTSLLVANMIGAKLFKIDVDLLGGFSIIHTAGMVPFPITFLLTDLVNEYYGRKATRRLAYIAFSMAALAFCFIALSRALPTFEGYSNTASHSAFENIFGQATIMYIASIMAFLCGTLLDIWIFGVFKRLTKGRFVWFRATGSTVISQIFDSFIVTALAFAVIPALLGNSAWTIKQVLETAATGYVLKFFIALAMTPIIYLGRWLIREWFGMTPVPADQ